MERNLLVQVQCGDKTCFDPATSKMCPYVKTHRWGSLFECSLFEQDLSSDDQRDDGMLMRCGKCYAAEVASTTHDHKVLCEVWGRFHQDSMMFDYPRYSWSELMRKIKGVP